MKLALIDSLGQAENIIQILPYLDKIPVLYFDFLTKLLLNRLSYFHKNVIVSSPDRVDRRIHFCIP